MDGEIQRCKSAVHYWKEYANRDLKQLESLIKEEGLFCVEWCLVLSVSTISYEIFFIIIMVGMKINSICIQLVIQYRTKFSNGCTTKWRSSNQKTKWFPTSMGSISSAAIIMLNSPLL